MDPEELDAQPECIPSDESWISERREPQFVLGRLN